MTFIKIPEYIVRPMITVDNDEVMDICSKVGLTIGTHTNKTMMRIDSSCIHVAEDTRNGKILGVCAATNLTPKLAFIGEYAVHPSYQKMGIGQSLWQSAVQHCGDRNYALYSTAPKMNSIYRDKCGFKVIPARKMMAYSGIPQMFNLNKYLVECDIEWISGQNIGEVIEYDEEVCGINRTEFLEYSIVEPGTVSLLARYVDSGIIAGFSIFKTTNFNTISPRPLYADTDLIAEALTYNCIEKFMAFDGVFLETWDCNDEANWLANKMGLKCVQRSPIMFTREDAAACNFKNIYFISPSHFYPF